MSKPRAQSALVAKMEPFEDSLRDIKRRWYYLTATHDELHRVSKGKPFRIFNSIEWQMAFDSNDMLVTSLASWVVRQHERGGVFGLLQGHLHELERKFPKAKFKRRVPDDFLSQFDTKGHEEAMRRLFPNASGRIAKQADVEALKAEIERDCRALIDDRNRNRAHPLDGSRESVVRLNLTQVGALFGRIERVLNGIRLIADWTTTSYNDMNSTPVDGPAEDFVDAVLIGPSRRRTWVMGRLGRDQYYARLHELHEADQDPKADFYFNEYEIEQTS